MEMSASGIPKGIHVQRPVGYNDFVQPGSGSGVYTTKHDLLLQNAAYQRPAVSDRAGEDDKASHKRRHKGTMVVTNCVIAPIYLKETKASGKVM
jgi:hypothetical protein